MSTITIPVEEAVGMVLPHDITEIRTTERYGLKQGDFKGPAFKKGHLIRPEDVTHLKRLGKDNIYVLTLGKDEIHENEAVKTLVAALAGKNIQVSGKPDEGKLVLKAACDGLLNVDIDKLTNFNMLGEVMCATLHNHTPVKKGTAVAATRLIPLTSTRDIVNQAVATCGEAGILTVSKLRHAHAGLVITGNEVYHGRIEDRFEPVLREKLANLGSEVTHVAFAPDDIEKIAAEIKGCIAQGADLIVTSGGMSVDPDDVTRLGIAAAGATDVVYGSPILPGAMFLIGWIGEIPVLGLPACGMFHKITVFDLILPRILTGDRLARADIAVMGHGGLCSNCKNCVYPVCHFGK